jgi:colicin import membrane protein
MKAILFSFLFHFALVGMLFFSKDYHAKHFVVKESTSKEEIIQSVSIDEVLVDKELRRIQNDRKIKKQASLLRERQLEERAQQLKTLHQNEQNKIDLLKAKANALKQAHMLEEKKEKDKLKALKRRRLATQNKIKKERQRYEALKSKRLHEKKQIALNKKREIAKAERDKLDKQRLAKLKAESDKLDKQRLAKLKADMHKEALKEEKAQKMAGVVNRYKALIINAISQHWIVPPKLNQSLSCRFEIHLADNGVVLSVRLLRSSGYPVLDRSAQTAIYKASPLPVPKSPDAFALFKVVSLTVKPEELLK